MCFMKTLKSLDTISFEKRHRPIESHSQEKFLNQNENASFQKQAQVSSTTFSFSNQDKLLLGLLNLINFNNKLLYDVDQKLRFNTQTIKNCSDQLDGMIFQSPRPQQDSDLTEPSIQQCFYDGEEASAEPLLQTLFGKQKYLYKLQIQGEVSSTIYKERNINIPVILKSKQNQKVLNSNIMQLCLGVCDSEGQWISENKAKENFMKGKTEVEMYHGEASFLKIYPREVSRNYPGGILNFVIYAKPSLVKFSSNYSSLEKFIDSRLIQPLVIKDISIKAKKRFQS